MNIWRTKCVEYLLFELETFNIYPWVYQLNSLFLGSAFKYILKIFNFIIKRGKKLIQNKKKLKDQFLLDINLFLNIYFLEISIERKQLQKLLIESILSSYSANDT